MEQRAKSWNYTTDLFNQLILGFGLMKEKEATLKLNSLYQRAIIEANIPLLLKQKKELEIVDLYLRIKKQLVVRVSRNL